MQHVTIDNHRQRQIELTHIADPKARIWGHVVKTLLTLNAFLCLHNMKSWQICSEICLLQNKKITFVGR